MMLMQQVYRAKVFMCMHNLLIGVHNSVELTDYFANSRKIPGVIPVYRLNIL